MEICGKLYFQTVQQIVFLKFSSLAIKTSLKIMHNKITL